MGTQHTSEDGSQLFIVRLWAQAGAGHDEDNVHLHLRGRVQHVTTGRAASFDDWPTLLSLFIDMMPLTSKTGETTAAKGANRE
jgi:hypothetical protein